RTVNHPGRARPSPNAWTGRCPIDSMRTVYRDRRHHRMPTQIATQEALHALFHPRAVAVIGASDDTTKHGYIVLTNVRDTGFRGGVYGISRRLTAVEGIPCH